MPADEGRLTAKIINVFIVFANRKEEPRMATSTFTQRPSFETMLLLLMLLYVHRDNNFY